MNESWLIIAATKFARPEPILIAVPVIGAVFAFLVRKGVFFIRLLQSLDNQLVRLLRGISWISGAPWLPEGWLLRTLQWIWFLGLFGAIFALYPLCPGTSQLAPIVIGYLLALSVGRTWMSEETRLLNGEEGASSEISDRLRPMAIWAFLILLALIPLSFRTVHQTLHWYQEIKGDSIQTWGLVTASFLLHSVVDFADFLKVNGLENIRPDEPIQNLPILLHFAAVSYVVVNGIALIARTDHAISTDLERLRTEGKPGQLVRQGTRVIPQLIQILTQATAQGAAGAATVLGEIAEARGSLPPRALRALIRAADHGDLLVREKAVKALGKTGHDQAKSKLLNLLLKDSQKRIIELSGISLRGIPDLPKVGINALLDHALATCKIPKPDAEYTRRYAIAMLLRHNPPPAWASVKLDRWIAEETEPDLQSVLNFAQARCSTQVRQEIIASRVSDLGHTEASRRAAAAKSLAPYIDDPKVANALLSHIETETDTTTRFWLVNSLYREQGPEPRMTRTIVPRLRKLLEDADPHVRVAATEGLGFFHPPMATTPGLLLTRALEDEDGQVQLAAFMALVSLRSTKQLQAYVQRKRQSPSIPSSPENPELTKEVFQILKRLQSGEHPEDLIEEWKPQGLPPPSADAATQPAAAQASGVI